MSNPYKGIHFFVLSLLSLVFLSLGHAFPPNPSPADYICPEGVDPIQEWQNTPSQNSNTPNTYACLYLRKHESNAALIRKVRQLILSGGVQSFGDSGKLEEYSSKEILFTHTDRQVMYRILTALRSADRYMGPETSEQITLRLDAYLMKLEVLEDMDFEVNFLGKGKVSTPPPRASTGPTSRGVPGLSLNFGDLSSNLLNIVLGHAKERNYLLDHRVKFLSIGHNAGFHRTFDMEKVYIGSLDKNPSESEQVGLQVMGTARFTTDPSIIQFESLQVMFGIRSEQLDSKTIQDSPGSRRINVTYGDPVYLMHKETYFSGEKKGQGFLFYLDGSQSVNSILLITATPVSGESQAYGHQSAPSRPEAKEPQDNNSNLNTNPKNDKKSESSSAGEGWNFFN